jgi:hypothetical protein
VARVVPTGGSLTVDKTVSSGANVPSNTYKINFQNSKIEGIIDNLDAIRQAIYMQVLTPRFKKPIYSFNYGSSLHNLIGKDKQLVEAEIPRLLSDCLEVDDRIISAKNFKFTWSKTSVLVNFTVYTIFGEMESEVNFNV